MCLFFERKMKAAEKQYEIFDKNAGAVYKNAFI